MSFKFFGYCIVKEELLGNKLSRLGQLIDSMNGFEGTQEALISYNGAKQKLEEIKKILITEKVK